MFIFLHLQQTKLPIAKNLGTLGIFLERDRSRGQHRPKAAPEYKSRKVTGHQQHDKTRQRRRMFLGSRDITGGIFRALNSRYKNN